MFKHSPSRNQRSKGFKIKHALQIALLIAVCIWLIYQVKHSHDKKKAFEESAAKLSKKIESQHDIVKFGRKDLNPRVERTAAENESHGEEEEEQDDEESKPEEGENGGRGDENDKIDEHEKQRTEEEAKREEDSVDEEERDKHDDENEEEEIEDAQRNENEETETEAETKESTEKVNEEETNESDEKVNEEETNESDEKVNDEERKESAEKENEEETKKSEDRSKEQENDRNTQEAREEQYKGDDASSAVFRDTQTASTEAESGGVTGNLNVKEQVNELGIGDKTSNLDEVTSRQKDSDLKAADGETTEGNSTVSATDGSSIPTVNATEIQEKGTEDNVSKLEDGSLPILATKESIDVQEVNNSSTSENVGTPSASSQNGTNITQDQTVGTTSSNGEGDLDHSNMTVGMSRSDSNASLSTTTENEEASNSGTVVPDEQNAGEKGSSKSSTMNENGDGDENEKSETATEEEDNPSSSTTDDNIDMIDSNPEVKEAQTNLGTLPEIETEGNNNEDAAAER